MGKSSGGTQTTTSDIPERYKDFVDSNLALAGTIANQNPNVPYVNPDGSPAERIAPFSPDQNAAFSVVRGLGGQYQPTARAGTAATQAAINSVTDPSVLRANYMNPYTNDVINASIDDIRDERDKINETIRLRNPYGGGSRAALMEAQNNANYLDTVGQVTANARADGFNNASQLGQSASGQLFGAGSQLTNQAASDLAMGQQFAGALSGVGQQTQGLRQAVNDLRYSDFLDQINAPLRNLSIRQSAIGMTPMGSVTRQPTQSGNTLGGTLGGLGSLISGGASLLGGPAAGIATKGLMSFID
tara:strand:+ start:6930 stop:7835 length:906 start_codon:yes stop_codon:yes gene_type:complete